MAVAPPADLNPRTLARYLRNYRELLVRFLFPFSMTPIYDSLTHSLFGKQTPASSCTHLSVSYHTCCHREALVWVPIPNPPKSRELT